VALKLATEGPEPAIGRPGCGATLLLTIRTTLTPVGLGVGSASISDRRNPEADLGPVQCERSAGGPSRSLVEVLVDLAPATVKRLHRV
jgi:hypothetical protein